MIREELYHRTVDLLFNAYYNNQLRFRSNSKCAVAHLIVFYMGYEVPFITWYKGAQKIDGYNWFHLLIRWDNLNEKIKLLRKIGLEQFEREEKHLSVTGYSIEELKMIIEAFESSYQNENIEHDYFKGLIGVLDVLREIHKITEDDLQPNSKTNIVDAMVNRKRSRSIKLRHYWKTNLPKESRYVDILGRTISDRDSKK